MFFFFFVLFGRMEHFVKVKSHFLLQALHQRECRMHYRGLVRGGGVWGVFSPPPEFEDVVRVHSATTVLPTDIAPTSAYWMDIKTTTYRPNSFSCGTSDTLWCWITDHFFHTYSALGQCTAFGRFIMVERVLALGSFPFYSIKDPKVRRVSF